jgi:hypothetical protein
MYTGDKPCRALNVFSKIVKTVKEPKKNNKQILCHEIEPNLSKDRAMREGDTCINPYDFSDDGQHRV